jgi:glycogen phosphorylase
MNRPVRATSPNEAAALLHSFTNHLLYSLAKDQYSATARDRFISLALTARDRLIERWISTQQRYYKKDAKRVYYLSAEFLMGRALANNLINLGLYETARDGLKMLNLDLGHLLEEEVDAGLGNGGLGRLAACFLDSMATLDIPGYGYGIRYEFGMFEQEIKDGWQVEKPDEWLRFGNPWEIARPEYGVPVRFGGVVEERHDSGHIRVHWTGGEQVVGMPYDTPIAGYGGNTVNTLRLWRARASNDFDLQYFNEGDYEKAVLDKNRSETISKVLYPSDLKMFGKELRLRQQYFFVACSLHDIVRRHLVAYPSLENFSDKIAIQLNDTHPAVAIPELMRILVDEHSMPWEKAWDLAQHTFGYTNHTLLSEALETWPVELFQRLLPRHLSIIYEINRRFLRQVMNRFPYDEARIARMSLIDEGAGDPLGRRIRMAYLAVVGSHSVNGVAALHTELLKADLLRDFNEMWPDRFNNKTNGVTPRRWLLAANPLLAEAITSRIGDGWITHLDELAKLVPHAEDPVFRNQVRAIKQGNKDQLARYIEATTHGLQVDRASIFDVQVKRLHEYKRQLLNVLHVIALYLRLKKNPELPMVPRTFIFGGKAAPAYLTAKVIIKLINSVAEVINADPQVNAKLKVVFLANYRVSLAERIFPASDLSEQISTAGKEASGTGNMKFALNGALTIGTLDGANIEMREEVGAENFFLFGLTAQQVSEMQRSGYRPRDYYEQNAELKGVLDLIAAGFFEPDHPETFRPLVQSLLDHDNYMLLADFQSYVDCQARVSQAFLDQDQWTRMAILNIARMGKFSSDRTIREYASEIWRAAPVPA